MKKITLLLFCLIGIMATKTYATKTLVGTGGDIQAAITAASAGDTLVLADGGEYTGAITISKAITLKSENAKTLPKITTAGIGLQAGKGYYFKLENVEVIGDPAVANKHMISTLASGDSAVYIKLQNVVAHDFERTVLRFDKATCWIDSVIVDNCRFYNFNKGGWNGFYWRDERVITKYFKLSNTTLDGFNEGILRFDGITFVKKIYIDRCTFNNRSTYNATKDANPLLDVNGPAGSVFKMTNCIITDIDSITVPAIGIDAAVADTIMNCRFFFDEKAVDTTNIWSYKSAFIKEDPKYADAANLDLSLPKGSSFLTAATDGGAIGDPRWVPQKLSGGIVAYWKFDETGGATLKDESGNSNGILKKIGDPLWVKGIVGNALNLGGGEDSSCIVVPNNSIIDFDSTTSFSVSVLVKVSDISGTDMNIVFKGATGKNTPDEKGHWYGMMFKGNELRFVVDDDITKTQLGFPNANLAMKMDGWNHIVGVRDIAKDSLFIYLNGKMVASMLDNTNKNITSGPLPLIIGNNQLHTRNFEGLLDDLQMYNKVLTAAEIKAMTDSYDLNKLPSNDATLSGIKAGGIAVTGFSAQVLSYNVELPFGTVNVPIVTATPNNASATVTVTNATALPGTANVNVKAEDGTVLEYKVNFTVAAGSNNADLTGITLDPAASLSPAFDKTVLTYTVTLPTGTKSVKVTVTKSDTKATVTGDGTIDVSSGSGAATIVVTAEDKSKKTYTINFTIPVNIISYRNSDEIKAYFINKTNELIINGVEKVSLIEIFDINGKKLGSISNGLNNVISLEKYALTENSVYFIRIYNAETKEQVTIKVIK